ncbi:MAG: hypothetical protein IT373_23025 [Polyangiaceae bacterium]|nr:hypothetical protein [Polyangiaceae bacterium]
MSTARATPASGPEGRARLRPWLTALALVAVVAGVLARGLGPALAGSSVGLDALIVVVDKTVAIGAQLFGIGATAALIALAVAIVKSPLSRALRGCAVGTAAVAGFGVLSATAAPVPYGPAVALGALAALLGLLVSVDGARSAHLRTPALALGAIAAAAIVRAVAIVLAATALAASPRAVLTAEGLPWLQWARALATLGFGLELTALGLALDWFTAGKARRVRFAVAVVVVLLAALAVPLALAGSEADAGLGSVLLNRSLGRLLSVPAPFAPDAVRAFVEVLGWLLALVSLLRAFGRDVAPAAVCLMLVSRGAAETALGAASLTLAALALAVERAEDLRHGLRPRSPRASASAWRPG